MSPFALNYVYINGNLISDEICFILLADATGETRGFGVRHDFANG